MGSFCLWTDCHTPGRLNNSRLELLRPAWHIRSKQDLDENAKIERGRTCIDEEVTGSAWMAPAMIRYPVRYRTIDLWTTSWTLASRVLLATPVFQDPAGLERKFKEVRLLQSTDQVSLDGQFLAAIELKTSTRTSADLRKTGAPGLRVFDATTTTARTKRVKTVCDPEPVRTASSPTRYRDPVAITNGKH